MKEILFDVTFYVFIFVSVINFVSSIVLEHFKERIKEDTFRKLSTILTCSSCITLAYWLFVILYTIIK